MNILLINHYAGSKTHGMEYRPYYLSREWVRLGHNVTVVAASYSHLRTRSPDLSGKITDENLDGIRYVWLKTPKYQGNGGGRVFNMLSFLRRLFNHYYEIVGHWKPDVVIASSTYPLDIFPAYRFSQKTGAKLIFEIHDLWPLSPIELGGMPRWHPFIVVMQIAENFACRRSDRIVSILPKTARYLEKHGMEADKFFYVPNGVDIEESETSNEGLPKPHAGILKEIHASRRFVVGYVGAHGLANSLDSFIEAAKVLVDHSVTFVLVGQGPEKESLQRKAQSLKAENIFFLPPVQKAAVPSLLAEMDSLFIGWKRQPLYRFGVSPNKLMDYMMAGKPVIHAIEAGNDLVAESGCGITVPPEDPEAIASAIEQLRGMTPIERQMMGAKGKEYILSNHDYRVLAGRFLDAMA
jgi:glycosyltransferase involved in cell wall biosynthesis